jgi:hypothetical protein
LTGELEEVGRPFIVLLDSLVRVCADAVDDGEGIASDRVVLIASRGVMARRLGCGPRQSAEFCGAARGEGGEAEE